MDSEKKIHGYLVKYALTVGIQDRMGEVGEGGYVYIPGRYFSVQAKIGVTFFGERADAEAAARKMATRKIASMEKQIAKLRKLAEQPKWEAPEKEGK